MFKSQRCNLKSACDFLKNHDNYLILTHAMPDGDTLGSSYALCSALIKMGKNARVICADKLPAQYDFFTNRVDFPEFTPETIISVDVADVKLLGGLRAEYEDKIVFAIDHHASHRDFAENLFLDGTAAAAAECVYDIIRELGVQFDEVIAAALYTGIATDTGCFKFSNTSPKTHVIAAELMVYGIEESEINRIMFDTKTKGRMAIEKAAMRSMEFCFNDRCAIMPITTKMLRDSGCTNTDLDGITAIPRSVEGVLVGVTLRQRSAKDWKVSMRSYPPVDVSAICAEMNGGGHMCAAGCEVTGTLRQAKKEILKHVKKALEEISCKD